jgi:hypothetical protein
MSGPPPSSWLGDPPPSTSLAAVASPDAGRGGASAGGLAPPALPTASADAAYSTWRHVRRVARDEASASGDLYDQLVNSSRETQYSLQPAGVSFGGWAWQAKEKKRGAGRSIDAKGAGRVEGRECHPLFARAAPR